MKKIILLILLILMKPVSKEASFLVYFIKKWWTHKSLIILHRKDTLRLKSLYQDFRASQGWIKVNHRNTVKVSYQRKEGSNYYVELSVLHST